MINYKIKNNGDRYELYFNEVLGVITNKIEKLLASLYFFHLEKINSNKDFNFTIEIKENPILASNIQNNIHILEIYYDQYKHQLISIWAGVNIPDWFK